MRSQENVASFMPANGTNRVIMDAITLLGGESKRVAAGLKAISRRHGANLNIAYRHIAGNDGVYIVYSNGGTWRRRKVELQWPTTGMNALLFITSNSDPKGVAYRYEIPKAIAAYPFESALIKREEFVHIKQGLYDETFELDDTFWEYPEYSLDPRSEEEYTNSAYALFEPLINGAEYYTQSSAPCAITSKPLFTTEPPNGRMLDSLDGYRGYFFLRSHDGTRSPVYYYDGCDTTYFSFPIKGVPLKGGRPVEVDTGDSEIVAVDERHLRAHAAKVERMRRRIESQPHKNVTRALEDWEMMIMFDHFAPRPHGFGSYVDKWLS